VVEVREGGDGQDVARDLLRLLPDLLLAARVLLARGEDAVVLARRRRRQRRDQPLVRVDLRQRRVLVQGARLAVERRDGVAAGSDLDVALRDLLGVVERVRVEERPDELPRDVLQRELEVGVLERVWWPAR